ncbi:AAA family ATPase [Botrimarina sp.]|uniref:AAA family ATPase n=1 Tax=Botrimarina sp. TaxID=2795802 RepID=UPI0032EB22A1
MSGALEIALGKPDRTGARKVVAVRGERVHLDRFDPAVAWKRGKFAEAAAEALGLDPEAVADIAATVATEAVRADLEAASGDAKPEPPSGWRPSVVCMAEVTPKPIRWLWPGRIAAGRVSLLVGMPGCGKSFLSCDIAARITTGSPWPDGATCERGSVVLVGAEDDAADTVRPRLDAHHADPSRVHSLRGVVRTDGDETTELGFTLADVGPLRETLEQVADCRLVCIDPIGSFLGGRCDAHRDNEVRAVLAPVAKMAEETGAAVLIIAHRRKSAGTFADDTALGSRAFTGLARSVWHLSPDPDTKGRRLLLPGKNNLGPDAGGLAFSIGGDPARLLWESVPVEMSADEAMARESSGRDGDGSALDEAVRWLREALAMGPRPGKELKSDARRDGVSERTLDRAKAKLGVENAPDGFGGPWLWRLPPSAESARVCQEFPESAKGNSLANTGETVADSVGDLAGWEAP